MLPRGLLVPLVLLIVLITVINPVFLCGRSIFNVFRQSAIFIILGTGMTIATAACGIDLSVGSTVALSGCIAALELKSVMFGGGTAVGFANGFA